MTSSVTEVPIGLQLSPYRRRFSEGVVPVQVCAALATREEPIGVPTHRHPASVAFGLDGTIFSIHRPEAAQGGPGLLVPAREPQ